MNGSAPGPVALITGAGRGIGRATAEAFAAGGYTVVLAEMDPGLGEGAEHALRGTEHRAVFLRTDVADRRSVGLTVSAALRRFKRVDCLVNNAGVLTVGPFADLAARELDRILAVNLRGPLLMTRAVLPAMLRRHAGSIINVASLLGKSGAGEYATYCASKFGLVGFTEALAEELRGTGVQVWAVCPGLVDTLMARKAGVSPAGRGGLIRPESVARVILDLATHRRRDTSGSAVDVLR